MLLGLVTVGALLAPRLVRRRVLHHSPGAYVEIEDGRPRGKRGPRGRAAKKQRARDCEATYGGHLRCLLQLEKDEEKTTARERLMTWPKDRLTTSGLALFDLKVATRKPFFERPVVRVSTGRELPFHRFACGDLVQLSNEIDETQGVVLERRPRYLDVVLTEAVEKGGGWRLDQCYSGVTYERMEAAIEAVTSTTSGYLQARKLGAEDDVPLELRRVLVQSFTDVTGGWFELAAAACAGVCKRVPSEAAARAAVNDVANDLNASQKRAALKALRRRVALVQGPPGTGKTRVAAAIVAAAVRLRDKEMSKVERSVARLNKKRALVCAASNVAADNVLESLLDLGVAAVRVGHPATVREGKCRSATLDARVSDTVTAADVLRDADVVVASCVGAGADAIAPFLTTLKKRSSSKPSSDDEAPLRFGLVVIDEAAQATEPACLVPVATALGASQLVLVGDHMQLPPTVLSKDAQDGGLGTSLFARLRNAGLDAALLRCQYRMHPTLASFSSERFYDSRVETCPKVAKDRRAIGAPAGFSWPQPARPLAFVPVFGEERHSDNSFVNDAQVAALVAVVGKLLLAGADPADLAVVTPYAAQARALADTLPDAIDVNTVDAFQGREKDVVLVSTVRSNPRHVVGFLADYRRLNVALTRARRALICFGDPATLRADPHWSAFCDYCSSLDCDLDDHAAGRLYAALPGLSSHITR